MQLDNDGSAAVVYAAAHGYGPVVRLLLQAGVDVNRRYAHGLTALMWAAGYDASAGVDDVDATIKTLIEHGAALDLKDDRGKTAADIARTLGATAPRNSWSDSLGIILDTIVYKASAASFGFSRHVAICCESPQLSLLDFLGFPWILSS